MLKNLEKFHAEGARRLVLIADDEMVNREMLRLAIEGECDVMLAEDGEEALKLIVENASRLSLVLLDLMMPGMTGIELLTHMRGDPVLARVPVIVLTADQQAEVECLSLGAQDFIPKPYPQRDIILARIRRTIELNEDRQTIQATERDPLTGLYNREFFYNYAVQYDQRHPETAMDAIVLDINHFHMINERYGKAYGDGLLKVIGEKLREDVQETGGIVCRREADTFMVYCLHRSDYESMVERAQDGLSVESELGRIRLRMGVYAGVDKSIDVERRFDRAKIAADNIRNNYAQTVALYDEKLHQSELYAERLMEDFHTALTDKQFLVYFQPKYNITTEPPALASAEALVRWQHPRLGFISPGAFIPLLEENGLIRELDRYVWRETARQIQDWKVRLGHAVPISVNVSRVDMLDEDLVDCLSSLLEEYALTPGEFLLEITESAYTTDADLIIEKVRTLREMGFRIEMDDFGTGYSSLSMISHLPIDALKLDMTFVRNAFSEVRDTRMLNLIIDIADYLHVPVIAEGVETLEQMTALRDMGCDIAQGFYFSRAIPAQEFERLLGGMHHDLIAQLIDKGGRRTDYLKTAEALVGAYESVYSVDLQTEAYIALGRQTSEGAPRVGANSASFFEDIQKRILAHVYPEDRERFSAAMRKDALIEALARSERFDLDYRQVFDGMPLYYRLTAFYATETDKRHVIIGTRSVEGELNQHQALSPSGERSVTFARIAQALSQDYFTVYYVNMVTHAYMEYSMLGSDHRLTIVARGEDFFADCLKQIPERILPEDRERVAAAFTEKALKRAVGEGNTFSIAYQVMVNGQPTHVSVKAMRLADDPTHVVVGMSNIDQQVAREREYEATKRRSITYASIAEALAADYFSIYYVDTETDQFIEYSSHEGYEELNIEKGGDDFFNLSRKNIQRVVHPDDRERFLDVFTKENLLKELDESGTFTLSYRLMFGDTPTYVSLKATRMTDESDPHIVIGVNNVDVQMKRRETYERERQQSLTYERIAQALSRDYFSIYLVNTETESFIEYSSNSEYQSLNVEQSGDHFFEDCRRNILRLVYPEDREKALAVWEKDRLLPEVEREGIFSITYRLMMDGVPVYINCKVVRIENTGEEGSFIVIGVSNVDLQMKREQAYERELDRARELASRDALTGVKSKHAFDEAEAAINAEIASGELRDLAIAICDVNGLKQVNDTQGHAAGDQFIRAASQIICNTFKHSPVYRIGGDEFAALLRGQDFEHRHQLISSLRALSEEHRVSEGIVIASGSADYRPGQDDGFKEIFNRADEEMYADKRRLKTPE